MELEYFTTCFVWFFTTVKYNQVNEDKTRLAIAVVRCTTSNWIKIAAYDYEILLLNIEEEPEDFPTLLFLVITFFNRIKLKIKG